MRKVLLGAALAASIAITPALAADLTNPTATVEHMKPAEVAALLTELGAGEVQVLQENGEQFILFKNGAVPFNIGFVACEGQTGCLGMVLVVGFDFGATRYPMELFNSFNKEHPFVSAIQLDGGKFAVSRMVVTEGGITRKNLATNIAAFASAPGSIMTYLSSQFVAGHQPNDPAPFQPVTMNKGPLRPVPLSKTEIDQIKRQMPALEMNLKR